MKFSIIDGASSLGDVRSLLLEYGEQFHFGVCFNDFQKELDELPGEYAEPRGCILIAKADDGEPAGCVALKPSGDACKMKRLYVKRRFRSAGLGRVLAEAAVEQAKVKGYEKMLLTTMDSMRAAHELYRSMGFVESAAFADDPVPGLHFFELSLK